MAEMACQDLLEYPPPEVVMVTAAECSTSRCQDLQDLRDHQVFRVYRFRDPKENPAWSCVAASTAMLPTTGDQVRES